MSQVGSIFYQKKQNKIKKEKQYITKFVKKYVQLI